MGGGDLNSKKSWHPNTMKNQERVWKAEQAAADEKKRILELQREHAKEKDREQLNDLVKNSSGSDSNRDDRLNWMYNRPDKKVEQEDYLLGREIGSKHDNSSKAEQEIIPAVARRVVGSSMVTAADDSQVDLVRKLREDPLLLVKERERAARLALLNNPLQRRRLTELLRKEKEHQKEVKTKKKPKKKDKELDNMLLAKLNALRDGKSVDIAALLESDDSLSSSSSEDKHCKKKKNKKHKKKKSKEKDSKLRNSELREKADSGRKKRLSNSQSISPEKLDRTQLKRKNEDDQETNKSKRYLEKDTSSSKLQIDASRRNKQYDLSVDESKRHEACVSKDKQKECESRRYKYYESRDIRSEDESEHNRHRRHDRHDKKEDEIRRNKKYDSRDVRTESTNPNNKRAKTSGISEEERIARLAAMAAAGAEHERDRGKRVARQRVEDEIRASAPQKPSGSRNEARALPDSLESRIHSNRHYIQRDSRHMNEHFARR